MWMRVLDTLGPVVLISLLGFFLRRRLLPDARVWDGLSRLTFFVGLPALLFVKIVQADGAGAGRVSLLLGCGMLAVIALAYLIAWLVRMPRGRQGSFVQAAFRSNLAYVGLPILAGANSLADTDLLQLGTLTLAPMIPFLNIAAVVILQAAQERHRLSLRALLLDCLSNPLVIACLAGYAYRLGGWSLPTFLLRSGDALGGMALPLALLALGASLDWQRLRRPSLMVYLAAGCNCFLLPAVVWLLAPLFGCTASETLVVCVFAACPIAVSSHIMVQQLGGDEALTADAVLLSSLLAVPGLALVLLLLPA